MIKDNVYNSIDTVVYNRLFTIASIFSIIKNFHFVRNSNVFNCYVEFNLIDKKY